MIEDRSTLRRSLFAYPPAGSKSWHLIVRPLMMASGLTLVVWAVINAGNITDRSASLFFVPVALGSALMLSAFSIGSRWQMPAIWLSILLVGNILTFQLVNAGYQLRYQHYKALAEMLTFPAALFATGIICQMSVVLIAGWKTWTAGIRWLRTNVRAWQAAVLAAFFFLPTTTVSQDVTVYATEFIIAGVIQSIQLGTVVLLAVSIPSKALYSVGSKFRGLPATAFAGRLAIGVAIWAAIITAVLNVASYERHPHVPDEVAYMMQARIFSEGKLALPAPPVPEAFETYLFRIDGTNWYPVTPPGWAILLSLGYLIGLPFAVNSTLAAVNVLLAFWILKRLYSRPVAAVGAALLAVSPWFVFLGMSYMTHMAALACFLAAVAGLIKTRNSDGPAWALAAGLALGFISLIRPLEALVAAGLLGAWSIGIGGKRLKSPALASFALGTILTGAVGLGFNAVFTGNLLKFPINVYTDEVFGPGSNAYGFGPERGMGWQLDPYPGHGPIDALINTNLNVSALNPELLGWPIGSWLLIGAFFAFGRIRKTDLLMLAVIGGIYIAHFFYYFSGGPDFGARYWFLMIVPLLVLTVRGLQTLARKLDESFRDASLRIYAAAAVLCVLTIATFIPWRAVDKYRDFRGMRADVRALSGEFNFGRSLVLIRGAKHPDYDSAFIYNPLDLNSDAPVYAWDRDPETRRKLLDAYRDRPVWTLLGPSITGSGFEVAGGPVSASVLQAPPAK